MDRGRSMVVRVRSARGHRHDREIRRRPAGTNRVLVAFCRSRRRRKRTVFFVSPTNKKLRLCAGAVQVVGYGVHTLFRTACGPTWRDRVEIPGRGKKSFRKSRRRTPENAIRVLRVGRKIAFSDKRKYVVAADILRARDFCGAPRM